MSHDPLDELIGKLERKFGKTFGLRGFAGMTFRISRGASFLTETGTPLIYTQRLMDSGEWLDFAKGTPSECFRNFVRLEPR